MGVLVVGKFGHLWVLLRDWIWIGDQVTIWIRKLCWGSLWSQLDDSGPVSPSIAIPKDERGDEDEGKDGDNWTDDDSGIATSMT